MNRSYRILVVVESIDVDDSSGSKANVALIKNLKKSGYDLRVLHYSRKNINIPGIECINIEENRRSVLFFISRFERYLRKYLKIKLYKPIENNFGFSFTLFNDRNSIVESIKQYRNYTSDIIITLSKGGSFRPHHALLVLPELHDKWIAYMHDPYPMHVFPPPYTYSEPGWKYKVKFVDKIFQSAKHIAFPSKLLMNWMGNHFNLEKNKCLIIPHQITSTSETQVSLPSFFNPGNFNLLHAGNLLWGRNPQGLIEGFKQFLGELPEAKAHAKLIFVGSKNYYSKHLKKASLEVPEIHVTENYLEYSRVNKMQLETTINVIIEAKAEISPFLPGKFPHCVIANRQILLLGPPESECRRLLGEDYSYWTEIDDVKKIKSIIKKLYYFWKEEKLPDLGRPDLYDYMSERRLKKILDPIFINL